MTKDEFLHQAKQIIMDQGKGSVNSGKWNVKRAKGLAWSTLDAQWGFVH